jgi:hypothetical protein
VQKYLEKRKWETLWNYYVSGYCGCLDIAGELIIFFARNFLKMYCDRHGNYSRSVVYVRT